MSYPLHTRAIIGYIEAHIREGKPDYTELERRMGFSYAHIRDFFKKKTSISLGQYVRTRQLYVSAFDLLHTDKSVMEIALTYGFSNHESYTRAFTKVIGQTPSSFRKEQPMMGKLELAEGIYGVGLLSRKERRSDVEMRQKEKYQNSDSTILYGVPKVEWGTYGGSTPYPICLKACTDYLGEDLDYASVVVACAGAFRFTWNERVWDMSNVDIYHTFTEGGEETVYSYAAKALGREFSMLGRTENTTKEEFIRFIKQHIDEGYPCIAQGIIGPPEACIITGYRDNGNTLLGWNFFQHDPAFGGKVSGVEYYIPTIAQKNETDLEAEFSFKYAAVHAGLGWIGKNDVLITREYGPRVRLSAVLINSVFEYGTVIEESGCPIECNLCVSICPCHALKGITWHIYEQRENIIDYHLCNQKRSEYIKKFGRKNACGLCMVVCPFGISEKEKELLLFE